MPEADGRDRSHRRRARVGRLPVLGVVGALLVVGLVAGRADSHRAATAATPLGMPVAAPAAALSSSWFCAGATGPTGSSARGTLVITNVGPEARRATVTILGTGGRRAGRSRTETVTVGAESRRYVTETPGSPAEWLGAIVDLDGGAVTVEQEVTGPYGTTASACATAGSSSWYFASGATLVNASSEIVLLNPYPTTAIASLSFTTDQGEESPQQFDDLVVPAGRIVAVDLGSHLRRRSSIATTVTTSTGRVVAWKTDIVSPPRRGAPILGTRAALAPDADPASPVIGVTSILGAPAPMTSWIWPDGSTAAGVGEQYDIYNPGTATADLSLAVRLQGGSVSAEPLQLTVGPHETTTITTGKQARIPAGSVYSASLTSTDGVPVVAERTVSQTAPQAARGIGEMLGATSPAPAWVVGAGLVGRHGDEVITVSDPAGRGAGPVTVTLRELAGGHLAAVPDGGHGTVGAVKVAAGGRVTLDLGVLGRFDEALLVEATRPVVVERDLLGRDGTNGAGISLAVPLAARGT